MFAIFLLLAYRWTTCKCLLLEDLEAEEQHSDIDDAKPDFFSLQIPGQTQQPSLLRSLLSDEAHALGLDIPLNILDNYLQTGGAAKIKEVIDSELKALAGEWSEPVAWQRVSEAVGFHALDAAVARAKEAQKEQGVKYSLKGGYYEIKLKNMLKQLQDVQAALYTKRIDHIEFWIAQAKDCDETDLYVARNILSKCKEEKAKVDEGVKNKDIKSLAKIIEDAALYLDESYLIEANQKLERMKHAKMDLIEQMMADNYTALGESIAAYQGEGILQKSDTEAAEKMVQAEQRKKLINARNRDAATKQERSNKLTALKKAIKSAESGITLDANDRELIAAKDAVQALEATAPKEAKSKRRRRQK